ncbi:thioesterase II family protein [Photobacterium sp. TLY01]|uniref:thioesterase II family protein n=1 Tax=Photobacterium sp. TLY01 TaxID=2907534 RepID=UPI001F382F26|nr:thioesterase domain-containing protein [Photobacterium sp. TLY01]UIP30280.1 thioesterase domain-containing protein [Photobacterium sp. TLY01]
MSANKNLVVYAFPHAGASANVYRPFCKLHQDKGTALLHPVEMPGRGVLGREPEVTCLHTLAEKLADTLCSDFRQKQLQGIQRWATFGHSFGGVLSVAVTDVMHKKYGIKPAYSMVSGSVPPCEQDIDDLHLWSDESLLQKMREDQGTPNTVLNEPALARRYVAQLRSDFLVRSQFPSLRDLRVLQPLLLVAASDDPHVTEEQLQQWRRHTVDRISMIRVNGDHFAVYRHWSVIQQAMDSEASFRLAETNKMDSWSVFQ